MISGHYNGKIDISEYWAIGDVRTEHITEIPSGTTGETQPAQDIQLTIIGMNHDDKADGSGKAAITVHIRNHLTNMGYMVSQNITDYSLWSVSQRRTWCNNDFKSALPEWLRNLIKPVTKISNRHGQGNSYSSYRGQFTTIDEVFLLSEFEFFGSVPYGGSEYGDVGSDGPQYEFMKTQSNRLKTGNNSWWTRSSLVQTYRLAGFISPYAPEASGGYDYGTNSCYIDPTFCI